MSLNNFYMQEAEREKQRRIDERKRYYKQIQYAYRITEEPDPNDHTAALAA